MLVGEGARAGAHARVRRLGARHVCGVVPCVLLVQWLPPCGAWWRRSRAQGRGLILRVAEGELDEARVQAGARGGS